MRIGVLTEERPFLRRFSLLSKLVFILSAYKLKSIKNWVSSQPLKFIANGSFMVFNGFDSTFTSVHSLLISFVLEKSSKTHVSLNCFRLSKFLPVVCEISCKVNPKIEQQQCAFDDVVKHLHTSKSVHSWSNEHNARSETKTSLSAMHSTAEQKKKRKKSEAVNLITSPLKAKTETTETIVKLSTSQLLSIVNKLLQRELSFCYVLGKYHYTSNNDRTVLCRSQLYELRILVDKKLSTY